MPLIEVTLAEGRTPDQLRALLGDVHTAVERSLEVPGPSIRVIIREVPPEHWLSGGQTLAEKAAAATSH
ncbi:4-oxalocrotonate tautomerase family protein [Arthrobacter sp. NPDC056691]|uniref:tautomerase family protein n=1 Tax=Arthrobacter sp. NPDC056691 TaxID=3345913 RepID=UPI00366E5D6C